ncbi:MAG TPA: hypothetical protein H9875_07875 [Candidatus Levilactobacillus faecigallinarum]|uniref:Uncharacterized protein n=1 Tax=Candidatus Levilactobacillus faecigallinarum TaxID=2838638 RepID=A0A9D1QTA5_9LACO|nr:hypothetical protein [Candidatus Levilactobacillus faecigallinarum]
MKKYLMQVVIYTRYFIKVALDNPGVLIYTLALPVFFLVLNAQKHLFQHLTTGQFINDIVPFIVWIVVSNALMAIGDVGALREQGYLKQYKTLVVNPSVLLVSKFLVALITLFLTTGLVGLTCSLLFRLAPVTTLLQIWGMLLLTFIPSICLGLPILAFTMRFQTLNTVVNAVLMVVMFGSLGISALLNPAVTNLFVNIISPVYFDMNVYALVATGNFGQFGMSYLVITLGWVLIGLWSYRHLKLLPMEGM